MTLHTPRRRGPADWDPRWSERVYGPQQREWRELKARYWRSRWTLFRRCLWCRKGHAPGEQLELNHLTYWTTRFKVGWVPLLFLVPLCSRCHGIETKLTRRARRWRLPFTKVRPFSVGEHVFVTFGVYLLTRSIIVGVVWILWHFGPW
jgi:hypothetical protein